jgi:hypothetical protein
LKVSQQGAAPGDLVFVVGFPGMTQRHRTYAEIEDSTAWQLPRSIRRATEQLAILQELARSSPELAIKVERRIQRLNNGLTKNRGVLDGLIAGGALEKKKAQERELSAWIAANPERQMLLHDVLPSLKALDDEAVRTRGRDAVFNGLRSSRDGSILGVADTIVEAARNRPKKDIDREPEYQQRNWARTRDSLERMQKTIDPTIDRAMLRYQLLEAAQLSAGERIDAIDRAALLRPDMSADQVAAAIDAFLDRLYAGTKLFDKDARMALLDKSSKELAASGDPFLDLAAALIPMRDQLQETTKTRQGARLPAGPSLHEGASRKVGRARPARRQWDASRHLRPRAGRGREGRAIPQTSNHARRHPREERESRGLRRAGTRARSDPRRESRPCERLSPTRRSTTSP